MDVLVLFLAATFALTAGDAPAAEESGVLLAANAQEDTAARLVETDSDVIIEVTGPAHIVPSVSIDVQRNGKIDADSDFSVSLLPDGTPCLSQLLSDTQSMPCRPPGEKARIVRRQDGKTVTTQFTLPRSVISGDGFGFGFAIGLWNEQGHYRTGLGGGDYRFGGQVQLVRNGPNFIGDGPPLPALIAPAVHRYQGCLDRGASALEPLDRSKLEALKAVPGNCAKVREASLAEAVQALVASGAEASWAERGMRDLLDRVEKSLGPLIEAVQAAPPKN